MTEINRLIQVADAATTATVTTVSIGGVSGLNAASLAVPPARVETFSHENIVAAQSSILNVDVAAEQSRLAASQVLVQASVAALSQANKLTQSLLRLLS